MKNVTVTMDETILQRARVAAAQDGKSLSKYIAETVERRVGHPVTQVDALRAFLDGPPWHVLDENGKAPTHDQMYGDD